MLVLSRKVGQRIYIGKDIWIEVMQCKGKTIRIGITAPTDIPITKDPPLTNLPTKKENNANSNATTGKTSNQQNAPNSDSDARPAGKTGFDFEQGNSSQ